MKHRRIVFKFFFYVFCFVIFVGVINVVVDPFWSFLHSNRRHLKQIDFDERRQKTNFLNSHGFQGKDAILLGSSVSTFIDPNAFECLKVFNYSANAMFPPEYQGWIDVSRKLSHGKIKTVILGLDFVATNEFEFDLAMQAYQDPQEFLRLSRDPWSELKTVFSLDTFGYSMRNILASLGASGRRPYYDGQIVKTGCETSAETVKYHMKRFFEDRRRLSYKYKSYKDLYTELVKNNPDLRFIVFTSPTPSLRLNNLLSEGLIPNYEAWLREVTAVFGVIYHFNNFNSVTNDLNNYMDSSHFDASVGALVAKKICTNNKGSPSDFGVLLTQTNVPEEVEKINKALKDGQGVFLEEGPSQ